ncbi:hypothetical protein ACOCJ5_06770 [Knoellia sp. CPCC 206450]|uniref:hypothetical protein n=1 Tax=Knoellia tibetensis TaxID=3404798 RepID=UPI003B436B18
MRRRRAVLATAILVTLGATSACGTQTTSSGATPTPAPTASPSPSSPMGTVVDLGKEVVGRGMLMQESPTADVELCLGAIQTSWPPQCGGPMIDGEVDWEALGAERGNGLTWSEMDVWAVGHFDPARGTSGTLTLTRPLSLTPPTGVTLPPQLTSPRFPQLCDDPYAGGGRPGGGSPEAQNALSERLRTLDGYIGSWVSDGSSMFNVLVTGDAAAARETLRAIWKGGLCVEQRRDLPSDATVRAAQNALSSLPGHQASWSDATTGVLHLEVLVLDEATRKRIVDAVEPWLDEEQVRVTSAFTALP